MNVHIKSITLNEFDGAFTEKINFTRGLNILSGENGTGKTTVIRRIKEFAQGNSAAITIEQDETIKQPNQVEIFALSPKRNSEKSTIENTINKIRTNNRNIEWFWNDIRQQLIDDSTFKNYSSFADLYVMYFDRARKDGGNQVEKMNEVTKEFNEVLEKVFPGYALEAKWNSVNGSPEIKLKIKSLLPLSLENLSLGQQEVLSLIFNIYTSTEFNHVYLIDEPEIHLNWNLEKGLFEFFEWFCTTYNKQIIVVTHSRVIFKPEFYAKCQFLVWENNKLIVKESATDAQKETIAGELAATINLIAPTSKTFFVEDNMHETVIRAISKNIGKTVSVVQCINSPNVKSFYNLSKEKSSAWKENGYYVIDGDNEGNPYPGEDRFIQLTKYSIDSYIFDIDLLAKLLNKPIADIQTSILALIKRKKGAIFSKGKSAKFGEALLEKLTHDYITTENLGLLDCSAIIEEFAKEFGFRTPQLMIDDFVKLAYDDSILDKIFEKKLVDAISA